MVHVSRFKFCLVGSPQAPVLELEAADVHDLMRWLGRSRYIPGHMVEIDGQATDCSVLIPAARIQIIMEEDG